MMPRDFTRDDQIWHVTTTGINHSVGEDLRVGVTFVCHANGETIDGSLHTAEINTLTDQQLSAALDVTIADANKHLPGWPKISSD